MAQWAGYDMAHNPTAVPPPVLPWENMTLDSDKIMNGASITTTFA
jgi:hypothetical protein